MKRQIIRGVLCLVFFAIGFLSVKIYQKITLQGKISENIQMLPSLKVYTFLNKKKDIRKLEKGQPLVLIYFNTDCHYCQGEVKSITDHPKLMKVADIVLVSDQSLQKLVTFENDYKLNLFPHIWIFRDKDHQFYHIFGTDIHPNSYIYSRNGHLLKHFTGEASAEAMMRVLADH